MINFNWYYIFKTYYGKVKRPLNDEKLRGDFNLVTCTLEYAECSQYKEPYRYLASNYNLAHKDKCVHGWSGICLPKNISYWGSITSIFTTTLISLFSSFVKLTFWQITMVCGNNELIFFFSVYSIFKKHYFGVLVLAQQKRIRLGTMRLWVQYLASLSGGSRIWRCHEQWCRLQMQLGSCVAVGGIGWQL